MLGYLGLKCNNYHTSPESNKQNSRDTTLDLTFFIRYKQKNSLENHLPLAQGERLFYLFRSNFYGRVCFDLPVERMSFICSY